MKTRLWNIWDRISGSFWFLPAFLVTVAAAMALLLPALDERHSQRLGGLIWLATSAEGARTVLSVIAGAMITVAGVVFSVTVVTLSIASSQFGSRVLRRRMRNRTTQLAFGAFLGTAVYCFLVLRTVEGTEGTAFVPHLSVAIGIVMAVVSIFVLIYFIHDVAEAVHAPHFIARLAADLNDAIQRLYPDEICRADVDDVDTENASCLNSASSNNVESNQEGYLQGIDDDSLVNAAQQSDVLIELSVRPGDFITVGDVVARIPRDANEVEHFTKLINGALIVGPMRTPRQDVNCDILELAQLTVRALSPGINDPFTAMNGIDRLSAALSRLAQREIPSSVRTDQNGHPRFIAFHATFPDALAAAYDQIRQNPSNTPSLSIRLLEGLERIARQARRRTDLEAIRQQADLVFESCAGANYLTSDLQGVRQQYERRLLYPGHEPARTSWFTMMLL